MFILINDYALLTLEGEIRRDSTALRGVSVMKQSYQPHTITDKELILQLL